jgi:nitrite reductase/ring-hydroxylating ferredoxin subunit
MPRMTDEEADALDELVTKSPPKVTGDGKNGFFMKHKGNIVILDDVCATWLRATSESTHKTPAELVNDMIREKIAVAI